MFKAVDEIDVCILIVSGRYFSLSLVTLCVFPMFIFFRKIGFAYIVKFIHASNGILDPSINGCYDFG